MQSLDLAEYDFLFALSFTTPTFDSEVAPCFGTLLATVNVALNMLGEVSLVLCGPFTQLFLPVYYFLHLTLTRSPSLALPRPFLVVTRV